MTTKQPGAFDPGRDAAHARSATTDYFQDQVTDARAALTRATADLAAAERRLAEITAGGRMTEHEALVLVRVLLEEADSTDRDARAGRVTREDHEQAVAFTVSVRRGLVGDGYSIPDISERTGGRR